MDSRKILEIYKLINDRSIKPVSAWPTIADIRPGTVVLDTDGVVKKCVYVFNNAGADWIDCGRPANLIALLAPTVASTVCAVIRNSLNTGSGYIWAIASSGTIVQNGLYYNFSGNTLGGGVGAGTAAASPSVPIGTDFSSAILSTDGSTFAKASNGSVFGAVLKGVLTASSNLYICGRTDGATVNFEGQIASISFYSGYNVDGSCTGLQLVDRYDFNKWDGSASGLSDMGNPYSVTKASPFTELVKALVPVSML